MAEIKPGDLVDYRGVLLLVIDLDDEFYTVSHENLRDELKFAAVNTMTGEIHGWTTTSVPNSLEKVCSFKELVE
jgi:hypothetical protein